tara:strand:- start:14 stop:505 length:492 start_codon:yes stop_codon:yes gene_type:complete
MLLKFKKLHPDAVIPQFQTKGSAGFDFHAVFDKNHKRFFRIYLFEKPYETLLVPPNCQCIISTGLAVVVPDGYEMQIRPRSGLAKDNSITISNSPATIDSDYRGELDIVMFNMGNEPWVVRRGSRFCQGVINKIEQPDIVEIEDFSEDDMRKDRGGGFGSTGS